MPSQIDVANGIDSADDPAVDPAADDPPIINHPTPSKTKSITIDNININNKNDNDVISPLSGASDYGNAKLPRLKSSVY